jgi:gamma-glutamyltranspeptidase/glutathione hydrolase
LQCSSAAAVAVDAAIAVQAMLSLVEPQSSGIGGGSFMIYYDAADGKLTIYDGREVAPAQATSTMFPRRNRQAAVVRYGRAERTGHRRAGRGEDAGAAHGEHGKLPWASLFGDAERAAREGFIVSPRLERMIHGSQPKTRAGCTGLFPPGAERRAAQCRRAAAQSGLCCLPQAARKRWAECFVRRFDRRQDRRADPRRAARRFDDHGRPSQLQADQARGFVPAVPRLSALRAAAAGQRGRLIQLMLLLERTDIAARGPGDPQAWFLFAEASRLMYADRDQFVGDPAFVKVPVEGLLDPAYIASRRRLIGTAAGQCRTRESPELAPLMSTDTTLEPTGTSHFIIRDAGRQCRVDDDHGREHFRIRAMVDGFFLNNEMTDFAFSPRDAQGRLAANAVAPGKKPRSSMAPAILLKDGRFAGAIGSAGGNSILAFVAKSLVAAVDWKMPMQQAIAQPNLVARGANFQGEINKFSPQVLDGMRQRGIDLKPGQGEDSGVHGVLIRDGKIDGGFDPAPRRREC